MRMLTCALVTMLLTFTSSYPSQIVTPQRSRTITITPSAVLLDIGERRRKQPKLPAAQLAQYGNELIEKRGFDYHFDVCDAVRQSNRTKAGLWNVRNQLLLRTGRKLKVEFTVPNPNPWQLPFQTVPIGVSVDSAKLYLNFYEQEVPLEDLILELSADGRLAFRVRADAGLRDEGESIESPAGEDLSFRRFRAGNKTYIVRFPAPCT